MELESTSQHVPLAPVVSVHCMIMCKVRINSQGNGTSGTNWSSLHVTGRGRAKEVLKTEFLCDVLAFVQYHFHIVAIQKCQHVVAM